MAKFKFFGMSEADAEIKSADAAINPLLVGAKITSIDVNGKPVPATSDAVPLALKISSLAATFQDGAGDAALREMTRNNTLLAEQAQALETRAVTAETQAATLTRENAGLGGQVVALEARVARLTADNAEQSALRQTANTEAGRVTAELAALNTEISKKALAFNAITALRDATGAALSAQATDAEKQAAAERLPVAEKLTAIGGAVTFALQRAGVRAETTPATPPTGLGAAGPKLAREEFHKLSPKAQTAFFDSKGQFTD